MRLYDSVWAHVYVRVHVCVWLFACLCVCVCVRVWFCVILPVSLYVVLL